jgi:hypothetical protein
MTTDWLLRVGDGKNLISSSKYRIWGIDSKSSDSKSFVRNVQAGDRLWFVTSESHGKLLAVATYRSHNVRELGPLFPISYTNEELGWDVKGMNINVEIHYTDLYGLNDCELLTHIKSPKTIRKYNEKCRVNLPVEYSYIVRYSRVTFEL